MPRKVQPEPAPTLLIQEIVTTWTKASRGAGILKVAAARRNALPWALPLPPIDSAANAGFTVVHSVAFGEADDFNQPRSAIEITPGLGRFRIRAFKIDADRAQAHVAAHWSDWGGAPGRRPIANLMTLAAGSWGQVAYNLRIGGYGLWQYQLIVINIGLFSSVAADSFTASPPSNAPRFLADLR